MALDPRRTLPATLQGRTISSPAGTSGKGGNPADKALRDAKAQLDERQRAISEGAWAIEQAFAPILGIDHTLNPAKSVQNRILGVVNAPAPTDFFGDFERSIVAQQAPQLKRQYTDTAGTMQTALARKGMLDSTHGANEMGRLDAAFADESARLANAAKTQSQDLRRQIEARKTELLDLNTASANPGLIGARARGEATSIVAPSPATDIGQVFSGFVGPVAAFRTADVNSPRARTNTAPVASGQGSSRIVGGR